MNMSLVNAKTNLSHVVSRAARYHERTTITVHGQPAAMVVSPQDIQALEETIEILSDTELVKDLTQTMVDIQANNLHSTEEIEEVIAARRRNELHD